LRSWLWNSADSLQNSRRGATFLWVMTSHVRRALRPCCCAARYAAERAWRGFWLVGVLAGSLDTIGNLFISRQHALAVWMWRRWSARSTPRERFCCSTGAAEWPTRRQFAGIGLALGSRSPAQHLKRWNTPEIRMARASARAMRGRPAMFRPARSSYRTVCHTRGRSHYPPLRPDSARWR